MKKTCPCCGYKTIDENILFNICEICYWEDDPIQSFDPDSKEGANTNLSLREAQRNFIKMGACAQHYLSSVRRPTKLDIKDDAFISYI
ncbi:hypothetical protein CN918_32355 [Priestia megaterium]|nr:hypothetical protein CN918_32355 [Priestia megaterium]